MDLKGRAEYVIQDIAGCGSFQVVLLAISILLAKAAVAYSILFMSFGSYNPGWRCVDNITNPTIDNGSEDLGKSDYTIGSCDVYKKCQIVEFNPDTSTVVTEWGLLCEKEWIPPLIISLQMVGMLVGSLIGGQLADFLGRKKIFYGACAASAILHLISYFSVSWIMVLVVRFFLGIFNVCTLVVLYINIAEFMTVKWRAVLMALPFWYVGGTAQALITMGFKDWRNVELIACIIFVLLFIPVFWVPESLRWLEVKGKTKKFAKVANKIIKFNGKSVQSFDEIEMSGGYIENFDEKNYTMLDIFRPGYKFITISVGILDFAFSLIYYALTFGVKSLYGDFYINMILSNIIAVPFFLCTMLLLRIASRVAASITFLAITIVCSLAAVGCLLSDSDAAKANGSPIFVSIAKATIDAAWLILYARVTELYPTVIRTTALGFASLCARVGGILAPFIIPNDKSKLYIFIIGSAAAVFLSCFVSYKIPETKGKALKETFYLKTDKEDQKKLQSNSTKEQET